MRNYISNREIDDLGESIVKSFFGKTNTDNSFMYVDIESIAWMMGLNIVYEEFSEDDTDKMGFLSNGIMPIKVRRNNQTESVVFPQGTIVIDTKVSDENCAGRLRFTIAHEVAHHILNTHNDNAEFCREFNSEKDYSYSDFENQLNMVEMQANRLAAAMLMPKFIIENAMNVMNSGEPVVVYGEYILPKNSRGLIEVMSNELGVSNTALFIKLKQLERIDYHPFEEYLSNDMDIWKDEL